MKKIKLPALALIAITGMLMTSCVSSKKYHTSQNALEKMRQDSITTAQQMNTLNQNMGDLEIKNSLLSKSIDSVNTNYSSLQKSYAYYNEYFSKQQMASSDLKNELASNLSTAGITDQDLYQMEDKVYVNLSEKNLFSGNSATLTSKGKNLINNLTKLIKSHNDVDVTVADMATSSIEMASSSNQLGTTSSMPSSTLNDAVPSTKSNDLSSNIDSNSSDSSIDKTNSSTGSNNSSINTDTNNEMYSKNNKVSKSKKRSSNKMMNKKNNDVTSSNVDTSTMTKVKPTKSSSYYTRKSPKKQNKNISFSETNSISYSSPSKSYLNKSVNYTTTMNRQNAVANLLLQNGLPNVKIMKTNNSMKNKNLSSGNGIQVILSHDMKNFYKNNPSTASSIGMDFK